MACSVPETFSVRDCGPCGVEDITLPLCRGFKPGMVLKVSVVTTTRTRFDLKDCSGNILLHVNPRIDQNVVVFNSCDKASWGPEERSCLMPITSGTKYCVHIVNHSDGYYIFINGEKFHFFKHRFPCPSTVFEIKNGQIFNVSYKSNDPKWAIQSTNCGMIVQEFGCGKTAPRQIQLQGNNQLSWIIIIGVVNCNAKQFEVNLKNSSCNILFHFNPRFTENCVVRNSYLLGCGEEEKHGGFPFKENQRFALAIVLEDQYYKTYVNGEDFITYNNRAQCNFVSMVEIKNDVTILKIMYQNQK